MLKKACDYFSGLKMTIVSGVFLLLSLILMLTGKKVPIDPAWVTVVLSGYPLLYLAVTRLIYKKWVSSCLLISIAMVASLSIGELFAAGEVAFIMAIGAILEDMTVARARKGLTQLMSLAPVQGRILVSEKGEYKEKMVPAQEIKEGDLLRVFPGETIPVDGKIVEGTSSVDQSVMTGESLPVDKKKGDEVYCGTMNCFGSIDLKATGVGEDSSLQKLIHMVEEADNKKAPMQRIADQWSVWLVPVALLIAVGAFLCNWAMGMEIMAALNRGVTVLVVFCPCALALATPTSIMAAIGQAAKHGVIIKSGAALEAMGKIDTIAFDKTGTLTYGKLKVSDVAAASGVNEEKLMAVAASLESRSEHPLGKAVVSYAKEKKIQLCHTEGFQMEAGKGICGIVNGEKIYCGNEPYLKENGISFSGELHRKVEQFRKQGKAVILVGNQQKCTGAVALSDVVRPEASRVIPALNKTGVDTVLLTGDNEQAAVHLAGQIGLSQIKAGLLPADKVNVISRMETEGQHICMIGDGVNDAPALKMAEVGVAMGGMGSDIAVEAADVALMQDDISQVVYLRKLARTTVNTIKTNITASMCINAVAVTLSVLGVLNPVTGALVHNAGSALVVLNAALLYDRKFDA